MAFTKILFALSLLAVTNAALFWPDNDGRFPPPQNNYRGYPSARNPFFSGFSDVLSFPFNFVSGAGLFPPVYIPSPEDIKNTKPVPGQTYTGIYAQSGGGEHYIVANLNGRVVKYYPPKLNFAFPDPPKFDIPVFKPIIIPPIMDRDSIKTHVAGPNEHFSGVSTSSHSFSSNVDGKITSGGSFSSLTNDGKNVNENVLKYGDDGDK